MLWRKTSKHTHTHKKWHCGLIVHLTLHIVVNKASFIIIWHWGNVLLEIKTHLNEYFVSSLIENEILNWMIHICIIILKTVSVVYNALRIRCWSMLILIQTWDYKIPAISDKYGGTMVNKCCALRVGRECVTQRSFSKYIRNSQGCTFYKFMAIFPQIYA